MQLFLSYQIVIIARGEGNLFFQANILVDKFSQNKFNKMGSIFCYYLFNRTENKFRWELLYVLKNFLLQNLFDLDKIHSIYATYSQYYLLALKATEKLKK